MRREVHLQAQPLFQSPAHPEPARALTILDVGCGAGLLAARMAESGHHVIGIDVHDNEAPRRRCERFQVVDVAQTLGLEQGEKVDTIVFADILEHTPSPESVLLRARRHLKQNGRIIASTGNVAHLFIRLSLLLGAFTYTERGILDRTHTRLFTIRTFRRLFRECGFRLRRVRYCPIPFENLFPGRRILSSLLCWLNMLLVWLWPGLFAYQVVLEAERDPEPSERLREEEILTPEFVEWDSATVSRAA